MSQNWVAFPDHGSCTDNAGNSDTIAASTAPGCYAEREADEYAPAWIADRAISPLGAADFFARMADERSDSEDGPAVLGWRASHPSAGERAQAYRAAARTAPAYPPVLSDAEFAALKSLCADDPDVTEFDFF